MRALTLDDEDGEDNADIPVPDQADMGNATHNEENDEDEPARHISLEDLKLSQAFIDALKEATLDEGGLPDHILQRLREPLTENIELGEDHPSPGYQSRLLYLRPAKTRTCRCKRSQPQRP